MNKELRKRYIYSLMILRETVMVLPSGRGKHIFEKPKFTLTVQRNFKCPKIHLTLLNVPQHFKKISACTHHIIFSLY
jgi:hypothetical protein